MIAFPFRHLAGPRSSDQYALLLGRYILVGHSRVDTNKRYTHYWISDFALVSAWIYSLYYWGVKRDGETPDEMRDWAAERLGYRPLSEIREDQRIAQWEINGDYKDSVEQNLESIRSPATGAVVTVYKNGELVKTVPLTGARLPVTTTAHSVSGLPTMYWPPGTITSVRDPSEGDVQHGMQHAGVKVACPICRVVPFGDLGGRHGAFPQHLLSSFIYSAIVHHIASQAIFLVRHSSGHNDPITWPEKLQVSVMS